MSSILKPVLSFNYKVNSKLVLFDTNSAIEIQNNKTQEITLIQSKNKKTPQKHKFPRANSSIHVAKTIDCLFNQLEKNKDNLFTINIQKVENVSLTPDIKSQSLNKGGQLWNKTRNLQKMVNAFLHPSVTKIDDNIIMTQTFKDSLLGDNQASCNNSLIKTNTNNNINNNVIPFGAFLLKPEVDKELIRVGLKERVYKCIIEGTIDGSLITDELDKLFNMNPEKHAFLSSGKNHLFNHVLPNGKTLLYVACQEGNLNIVKFLMAKGLNPNIKVKYGNMEDCCLWVACRWDYYDIVQLLLTEGNINIDDIKYAIDHEKMSKKMLKRIHNCYLLMKSKDENKKGCLCF